jgi:hypothetical protein
VTEDYCGILTKRCNKEWEARDFAGGKLEVEFGRLSDIRAGGTVEESELNRRT